MAGDMVGVSVGDHPLFSAAQGVQPQIKLREVHPPLIYYLQNTLSIGAFVAVGNEAAYLDVRNKSWGIYI
jgi:hypothetical protein